MHHDLILHFLKVISQNQDVYPLLIEHKDKLDNNFASELRKFASLTFANQPGKAVSIARILVKFSNLIEKFEQGNFANNLEIAIAGYESALTAITWETFPQGWASIQQALVSVYQQRQNILSAKVEKLQENTLQHQNQINDLTEKFQQEKQQASELKAQLSEVMQLQKNIAPEIDLQPIVSAIQEKKLPLQQFNTVIFYDIENLTEGYRNPSFNFSLRDIIQDIKRYNLINQIAGQYAYADWSNSKLKHLRNDIQQLGIEPMQIFGFNNHKNAADIQLVIDAVELIHRNPSLEIFAIVSGDGGFSCLAKKLHEYGKTVIGCGYENQTSSVLAAVCDYFFRVPDPKQKKQNQVSNSISTFEQPQLKNDRYREVLEYLKAKEPYQSSLKQDGVDLADLHNIFREKISDFDYQELGFSRFKQFLNSIIQSTEFKIVNYGINNTISRLKIM